MSRNLARAIDKTYLSLDSAEERGLVHRDYIAHCFRWSHVTKFLNRGHSYKDAIVLDVGCGKEMPLAKTLYVNKMTPRLYVGVDANKFSVPEMLTGKKIPIRTWAEADFCALDPEDVGYQLERVNAPDPPTPRGLNENGIWEDGHNEGYRLPNIFTCFEVLEHVTPEHCRRMLQHAKEVTSNDCHFFISTPCWNGDAAGNHINEMTFASLGALIEDLGFDITGVYGTFASISDYKDELSAVTTYDLDSGKLTATTDLRPIFDSLRNYYDTNALSVIFAPLFPAKSRNALWHLTKKKGDSAAQTRMFPAIEQAPTPWSQHPNWRELAGQL